MDLPFALIEVFNQPEINFKGNTAAVIQLENSISDEQMQRIAADIRQPATTFLWTEDQENLYHLRWFAPDGEIDLCGHGTLAALTFIGSSENVSLKYKHGTMNGKCTSENSATFELAAIPVTGEEKIPKAIEKGIGIPVKGYFTTSNKQIILVESEELVRDMKPDFNKLRESEVFGYVVTAAGNKVDFVSRTLVPHVQQLEDPATGSSHALLTPFWAKRLGKNTLYAHQLSSRGGAFNCTYNDEKVQLNGRFSILATGHFKL